VLPHTLPEQVPLGQTLPHAPQLFGSLVVSVQVPLHSVCPVGQPVPPVQVPPVQVCPEAQALPQAPQLFGSVPRLVQVPLQLVWPVPQVLVAVQVPF
jgi:hypothetical protein